MTRALRRDSRPIYPLPYQGSCTSC